MLFRRFDYIRVSRSLTSLQLQTYSSIGPAQIEQNACILAVLSLKKAPGAGSGIYNLRDCHQSCTYVVLKNVVFVKVINILLLQRGHRLILDQITPWQFYQASTRRHGVGLSSLMPKHVSDV